MGRAGFCSPALWEPRVLRAVYKKVSEGECRLVEQRGSSCVGPVRCEALKRSKAKA